MTLDTLGCLINPTLTLADEQERAQVQRLCEAVRQATQAIWCEWHGLIQVVRSKNTSNGAQAAGVEPWVVKLPAARKGFVLLPRRQVVGRTFGWLARPRRLVPDYGQRLDVSQTMIHIVMGCLLLRGLFV